MNDPYFIEIENLPDGWQFKNREIEIEGRVGTAVDTVKIKVERDGSAVSVSKTKTSLNHFNIKMTINDGDYTFYVSGLNSSGRETVSKKYGFSVKSKAKKPVYEKFIVLEQGHGTNGDMGAVHNGVKEYILNGFAMRACEEKLRKMGYVNVISTDDKSSLFTIGFQFAKIADVFVSIHHNAYNQNAQGSECLYSQKGNRDDKKLADIVARNCALALGITNRQGKSQGLSILSGATRARFEGQDHRGLEGAVLAEGYFIDAPDVDNHVDWSKKYGEALALSIDEFLS